MLFPCSNRVGRSFCSKQPLQKLCYEVYHATSYVHHRDDNYAQIGSSAVFYKTFSSVHNLLIMPSEILSSVLLSLSNPNFSHDVSLLSPQMLIFVSGFYNLGLFPFLHLMFLCTTVVKTMPLCSSYYWGGECLSCVGLFSRTFKLV